MRPGPPAAVAIDSANNVWMSNYDSLHNYSAVVEISNTGTVLSGGGNGPYTGGGLDYPFAVAVDGAGDVWVPNDYGNGTPDQNSITEISNSGLPFLSGTYGYDVDTLHNPFACAIDGSGDVWIASDGYNNGSGRLAGAVIELIGAATPVVTPLSAGVTNNTLGSRP